MLYSIPHGQETYIERIQDVQKMSKMFCVEGVILRIQNKYGDLRGIDQIEKPIS